MSTLELLVKRSSPATRLSGLVVLALLCVAQPASAGAVATGVWGVQPTAAGAGVGLLGLHPIDQNDVWVTG